MSDKIEQTVYRPISTRAVVWSIYFAIFLTVVDMVMVYRMFTYTRQAPTIFATENDEVLQIWLQSLEAISNTSNLYIGYATWFGLNVTALFVIRWVYLSLNNTLALGFSELKYTPKMVVIAFFIPIVNLFVPYIVIKKIANWSLAQIQKNAINILLGIWWFCYISAYMGSKFFWIQNKSLDKMIEGDDVEQDVLIEIFGKLTDLLIMSEITSILFIISSICLVKIINITSQAQQQLLQLKQTTK